MRSTRHTRRALGLAAATASIASLCIAPSALANHPVLVEGNCNNANDPMFSPVPAPGTCGDYDGDGRIGNAEDSDGDRVFGTINAANNTPTLGANNNGTITIVASGLFAETVNIGTGSGPGNLTLEGAPGVEANIDAVRQGDPQSGPRQNQPGIVVNTPSNRYVVIRNVQSRNWTSGILIQGNSRVALEGVRAEHNINYGVEVNDNARVAISNSEVYATGRRQSPSGDFPSPNNPNPGRGIEFDDRSSGTVFDTRVAGSFRDGVRVSGRDGDDRVCLAQVNIFDNDPDVSGVDDAGVNCIGTDDDDDRGRDRGRGRDDD